MDKLRQAIKYIKDGERYKGKKVLIDILRSDPNNEIAWLWMSVVVDDLGQKQECLQKVLEINPNNQKALERLSRIKGSRRYDSIPNSNDAQTRVDTDTAKEFQEKVRIDEATLRARLEAIRQEQDLTLGILGGLIGGGVGMIVWGIITYTSGYQFGFAAMGVGYLVGLGVRVFGKGVERKFGIAGGIISLASVVLGNFFVALGLLARILEVNYVTVLVNFVYSKSLELMIAAFSPMDLVFYAIAVYEGYRFSFRKISRKELFKDVIVTPNKSMRA